MRKGLLALVTVVALSTQTIPANAVQCVPYARQISGIDLKGDAWMWWQAAAGRYDRGRTPQSAAILVFSRQGAMRHGHVSVVTHVVNSRMVLVDHANWAPARSAGRGEITHAVPVQDVSAKNDWSKVRVWYEPTGDFGTKIYRTDGFIYNPERRSGMMKASLGPSRPEALSPADRAVVRQAKARAMQDVVAMTESGDKAPALGVPPSRPAAPQSVAEAAAPVVAADDAAAPIVSAATKPAKDEGESAPALGSAIAVAKSAFGSRSSLFN